MATSQEELRGSRYFSHDFSNDIDGVRVGGMRIALVANIYYLVPRPQPIYTLALASLS